MAEAVFLVKIGTCPSLVDPRAGDEWIIVYVIPVGNCQRSLHCGKRPYCGTDAGLQAGCINPTQNWTQDIAVSPGVREGARLEWRWDNADDSKDDARLGLSTMHDGVLHEAPGLHGSLGT